MRTKFSGILTLLLAFFVQISFAQEKTISGSVTDDKGLPLPGVNIVVKNTTNGTQTDFDGNYSIKTNKGAVLTFTYVGFKKEEIAVGDNSTINVQLSAAASELDEVVIEAFRTTAKSRSSVSSVTISAQTIEGRPNPSIAQSLQGQVAGLNITTNSGQPGSNSLINLRGVGSLNGNTEPLFILDGTPIDEDNFRSINQNEIESISVLKDAAGTAIYGNRGANGVIIIKTKEGKFNQKLKINYTGSTSLTILQDNDFNLMNSQQLLTLERGQNTGRGGNGGVDENGNSRPLTDAEIATSPDYDWVKYFFRPGRVQEHQLSLTSGSQNNTTYTSLGYLEQEGTLVDSKIQRFNFRNNITGKSENNRFRYSSKVSVNFSKNDEPERIGNGDVGANLAYAGFRSVPYLTPDDYTSGWELAESFSFLNTPLYSIDHINNTTRVDQELKILASIDASYKITDNITAIYKLGADYTDEQFLRSYAPEGWLAALFARDEDLSTGGTQFSTPGIQALTSTRVLGINSLAQITYEKTFAEKHSIYLAGFTEYFRSHLRQHGSTARGLNPRTFFPGDGASYIGDNIDNDAFVDGSFANIRNGGLFSYFGQLDYDYNQTYGLGATLRRDASFRFAESNRWGTFYSVSGRWNMHQESFMQNSAFDYLKLRASYGTTGNQRIVDVGGFNNYFGGPDRTLDLFSIGSGYAGFNESIFLSQIGDANLQWEVITQLNVGMDFEIFNKKLRGALDYYVKDTDKVFQFVGQSPITGTVGIDSNSGELRNSGFDVELHYDLFRSSGDGFNLTLNFVGNYNKQEVIDLPSITGEDIPNNLREGGIIDEYRQVRYAGVNPANGNLLFLDANGDLTENPNPTTDAVWSDKNIYPDYQGSFGFDIAYKGFYLTTNFTYSVGAYRFNFDEADFINPSRIGQQRLSTDILRAWTPDNRNTDIPSLQATNLDLASDRFLKSSDYLRLRFASLGYNFPKKYIENTGFDRVRIFTNAQNLVTFTKWRGADVEGSLANSQYLFPAGRTFTLGVEFGF